MAATDLLGGQAELALRLLVAAVLGAAIGLEREIHLHAAGMRTHLLVALGAAMFTILSIHGFTAAVPSGEATNLDPTRIAAQIVSGIGFLGAGAIIHYGASVRGLTTAASLWATAAIGLAVGAREYGVGVIGTAIVLFSLGPLNAVAARIRPTAGRTMRIRLELGRLAALGAVSAKLAAVGGEMTSIESRKLGKGRYEVELDVRLPPRVSGDSLLSSISETPDVDVVETASATD